jgi:hypothetical protein
MARGRGGWADPAFAERVYIILIHTVKRALARQVSAGAPAGSVAGGACRTAPLQAAIRCGRSTRLDRAGGHGRERSVSRTDWVRTGARPFTRSGWLGVGAGRPSRAVVLGLRLECGCEPLGLLVVEAAELAGEDPA